jgi:hypothetical protein
MGDGSTRFAYLYTCMSCQSPCAQGAHVRSTIAKCHGPHVAGRVLALSMTHSLGKRSYSGYVLRGKAWHWIDEPSASCCRCRD